MIYNTVTKTSMADSRLKSNIRRQAIHNVILFVGGFIILIVLIIIFGGNLLTAFSLFVEKSQGTDASITTDQQSDSFVSPPTLNSLPNATKNGQIDVSGFAQKGQTVMLYVNDELVDKADVGSDNKFHFSSVGLKNGENTIKAKTESDNKQSDFSSAYTVSYLKNPPSLSINSPQDGQGFNKGSSPTVSVSGQTDAGVQVTVNGSWAIVDDQGKFNYLYTLKDGDNDIKIISTDNAGNQTTKEIHIHTQ